MRFNALLERFKAVYPNGSIYTFPGIKSAYMVQYSEKGKLYRYTAGSHVSLAYKLRLIHEPSVLEVLINEPYAEYYINNQLYQNDEHGNRITEPTNDSMWSK